MTRKQRFQSSDKKSLDRSGLDVPTLRCFRARPHACSWTTLSGKS